MLIAFEGLDQSGKETQAKMLGERLSEAGHHVRALFLGLGQLAAPDSGRGFEQVPRVARRGGCRDL